MATIQRYEDAEKEVVGFAVWERRGASDAARRWQGTSISKVIRRFCLTLKDVRTFLFDVPKRSISLGRLRELEREIDLVRGSRQPAESWYLCLLGVDPNVQRMGVGRRLLEWGIDRSEEEGIPSCLEATQAGVPLYRKMGFEQNGWMSFDNGQQKQQVMTRACLDSDLVPEDIRNLERIIKAKEPER